MRPFTALLPLALFGCGTAAPPAVATTPRATESRTVSLAEPSPPPRVLLRHRAPEGATYAVHSMTTEGSMLGVLVLTADLKEQVTSVDPDETVHLAGEFRTVDIELDGHPFAELEDLSSLALVHFDYAIDGSGQRKSDPIVAGTQGGAQNELAEELAQDLTSSQLVYADSSLAVGDAWSTTVVRTLRVTGVEVQSTMHLTHRLTRIDADGSAVILSDGIIDLPPVALDRTTISAHGTFAAEHTVDVSDGHAGRSSVEIDLDLVLSTEGETPLEVRSHSQSERTVTRES